jgi:hypothetical protein
LLIAARSADQCGNDANAGWDVVTQQSVLLSEFDDQWCGECGEVTRKVVSIPPRSRIDAARAALAVEAAAAQLLAAAQAALMALTDRPAARAKDCVPGAIAQLTAAIAGSISPMLEHLRHDRNSADPLGRPPPRGNLQWLAASSALRSFRQG